MGKADDLSEGNAVGYKDGTVVDSIVGIPLGNLVGRNIGCFDGFTDGCIVDGAAVGTNGQIAWQKLLLHWA